MTRRSLSAIALIAALTAAPALTGSHAAFADDAKSGEIRRLPESEQSADNQMMRDGTGNIGQSMMSMQAEMNRMFSNFFNDSGMMGGPGIMSVTGAYPAVDVVENPKNFEVRMELPGIDPDSVDLSVTDRMLTVSGEKKETDKTKTDQYVRRETSYGAFERSVGLPRNADTEHADASWKNGVLTVTMPKKANAEPETRQLKIHKES